MLNKTNHFQVSNNPQIPGVWDIEPEELLQRKKDSVIVDVRRSEERTSELGHIQDSIWIQLDFLSDRVNELPKDKDVVFVCRSGGRSAMATKIALESGFSKVYNMRGGMILWNESGFPVSGKNQI
jgi:rhodanese-related sulfurtransferase